MDGTVDLRRITEWLSDRARRGEPADQEAGEEKPRRHRSGACGARRGVRRRPGDQADGIQRDGSRRPPVELAPVRAVRLAARLLEAALPKLTNG